MSKLKQFSRFINEDIDRLRELGMAPKAPLDERWSDFVNEWSADPQVDELYSKLKARTSELMAQFIDDEDLGSDEWTQMMEWMGNSSIDDIGILEWMIYNGVL